MDGYRSSINLYILPTFGNQEIETIEPEAIQAWVDEFEKPGAAEKAFKCLRQLFNWAIRSSGYASGIQPKELSYLQSQFIDQRQSRQTKLQSVSVVLWTQR